ncbi:hypothetical protein CMZ84_08945 [Lysobacteraceae bacterium NML93-0399]|nr:hypothetical protein CMZ84_08945 [Xanthomonadaceae bacterium NML93-0399]
MTPALGVTLLLVLAVVLSIARLVASHARAPREVRPAVWRSCVLAGLTVVSAVLLHRVLLPPAAPATQDTLVVLTAQWSDLPIPTSPRIVALPEAGEVPAGVTRAPDLATALRREPGTVALVVVGAGLELRDREAVGERALDFVAADLPSGIVELDAPRGVGPGARFVVRGRLAGFGEASVTLFDPANRPLDSVQVDEAGRFGLSGTARGAGATRFTVAIDDVEASPSTRVTVPVVVEDAPPPRVLLLAGALNPDVRALRRWAEDAGLPLRWRAPSGHGTSVGDAPALDARNLAEQDLVLLDARGFDGLGAHARTALRDAVRAGLGLLVHAPEPPSAALRGWLQASGLPVSVGPSRVWRPDPGPDDVARLRAWSGPGSDDVPFDPLLAGEAPPTLGYLPLRGGLPVDATGPADMMRWQAYGHGRIGVATIAESWQLPLAGRADLHAALWSGWAATLARADDSSASAAPETARVGDRAMVCGAGEGARVIAPDGAGFRLVADPTAAGCAGLWPRVAGWHRLVEGEMARPFLVRARDEAPGLHAASLQAATGALVRSSSGGAAPVRAHGSPLSWFAIWLVVTAALWWLHRSRHGRRRRPAT